MAIFPYDNLPDPSGSAPAPTGLVTTDQAALVLPSLSSSDLANLPYLVSQASAIAEKFCNRKFAASDYDQTYDIQQDESLILRLFPVNYVYRLSTNPLPILNVTNNNNITGMPRSFAGLDITGTYDTGFTVNGIKLTSWVNGIQTSTDISIVNNNTVGSLAAAINGAGNGWQAWANTGYENWPSSDLMPPQGMGSTASQRFSFLAYIADIASFRVEPETGELRIDDWSRMGPWAPDWYWDGMARYTTSWRSIRIKYNAGFTNIPQDVQQAVLMIVKHIFQMNKQYSIFKSEKLFDYQYEMGPQILMPPMAQSILTYYKNYRASGTI